MKLSFFGADQCVTGSCHCLEINGKRILIDCGLQQGRDEVSNGEFPSFTLPSVTRVFLWMWIRNSWINYPGFPRISRLLPWTTEKKAPAL